MSKKLEIIGQKFGRLTVLEFSGIKIRYPKNGKRPYHMSKFNCVCDCGNKIEVLGYRLTSKHTASCGCINKERTKKLRLLPKGQYAFNALLSTYKYHAKTRDLKFELTDEECETLFKSTCFYCGIFPNQSHSPKKCNGNYIYNGIDRVDNDEGYSKENCVACCIVCNRMKMNHTLENFLLHIKHIYYKHVKVK